MSDPDRAAGWDAAFGAFPDRLTTAAARCPRDGWLTAVALGGRGHYAAAAARLRESISGADPVIAALAAATRASHLRQLGGHAEAAAFDGAGLRRLAAAGLLGPDGVDGDHPGPEGPEGADAAAARSDVLLGLAADALGRGRIDAARRLFGIESASVNAGWRARVRRGWVAAEIELADGRAGAAIAPAMAAAEAASDCPSIRHRVKSGLVLGAAMAVAGDRDRALALITGTHAEATRLGLAPLAWPSALLLADLDPDRAAGHRRAGAAALHGVLQHTDPVGRAVAAASPWVPTWLFSACSD